MEIKKLDIVIPNLIGNPDVNALSIKFKECYEKAVSFFAWIPDKFLSRVLGREIFWNDKRKIYAANS